MAWTAMSTQVTGYVVTASDWNEISNNMAAIDDLWNIAAATYTDGAFFLGSGSGEVTVTARPSTGEIFIGNASGDPTAVAVMDSNDRLKHEYGGLEFNLSALTTGGLIIGDSSGVATLLAYGSDGQIIKGASGKPSWGSGGAASVATGTYTGNGGVSQAITGVGFQVKYVLITHQESGDGDITFIWTTDVIVDDDGDGMAIIVRDAAIHRDNNIIALGSDGFTVDDNGSDDHPNKNGTTYNYYCTG